jgi:hypothetical protein
MMTSWLWPEQAGWALAMCTASMLAYPAAAAAAAEGSA